MSDVVELIATMREEVGTGPARALRREGMVPAIIYGSGKKPLAIAIEEKEITKLYRKPNFISTVMEFDIGKKKYKVLPKAVELHPITDIVRHVDFIYLDNKIQKTEIPIVYEGKDRAIGVKRGGFFNIVKRTVLLQCPVENIPKNITIDVTGMYVGQSIKVTDLQLPAGCTLVRQSNYIIASIIGSRTGKAEAEETPAAAS